MPAGKGDTGVDVPGGRVFLDRIEKKDLEAGLAQRLGGALRMAGFFQAGIGNQHDALAAQLACQCAQPVQPTHLEHHPIQRLVIERRQWHASLAGTQAAEGKRR